MRKSPRAAVLLMGAGILPMAGGGNAGPREWLDAYLQVKSRGDLAAQKAKIAPGARIWFEEKAGDGELIDLDSPGSQWDRELNATLSYTSPRAAGDEITAAFLESNDFYRLVGIDAWKATITFRFDPEGRILEELYVPGPGQPRTRDLVAPFLEWARTNRPGLEEKLYPGGKFVRNRETARLWRESLTDWRAATGRPLPKKELPKVTH